MYKKLMVFNGSYSNIDVNDLFAELKLLTFTVTRSPSSDALGKTAVKIDERVQKPSLGGGTPRRSFLRWRLALAPQAGEVELALFVYIITYNLHFYIIY